jgi:hypothetical protein
MNQHKHAAIEQHRLIGQRTVREWRSRVLIEKSIQSDGGKVMWRVALAFPCLERSKLHGQSRGDQNAYGLRLAQTVSSTPGFKFRDDGGDPALSADIGSVGASGLGGKEGFESRGSHRVGGGATYFPLLKRTKFDWQTGVLQHTYGVGLAEPIRGTPGFKLLNRRRKLFWHFDPPIMNMLRRAGNWY